MYRRSFILAAFLSISTVSILGRGMVAQEARLPTEADVKVLQARYQAERDEILKKGIDKRFPSVLMTKAEELAQRGDKALADGRLFQASEAFSSGPLVASLSVRAGAGRARRPHPRQLAAAA